MKRALFIAAGILWMLFAFGFLFFLYEYLVPGAGLQFWIPVVSSGSVLIGLVHFVGLCATSLLCFAVGVGCWARGLVRPDPEEEEP
jgi:hypothetical protein